MTAAVDTVVRVTEMRTIETTEAAVAVAEAASVGITTGTTVEGGETASAVTTIDTATATRVNAAKRMTAGPQQVREAVDGPGWRSPNRTEMMIAEATGEAMAAVVTVATMGVVAAVVVATAVVVTAVVVTAVEVVDSADKAQHGRTIWVSTGASARTRAWRGSCSTRASTCRRGSTSTR